MQPLQSTATMPGCSGQRNCYNALPQCLGAVGFATPSMHCLTAWEQWVVELLCVWLLMCPKAAPTGGGPPAGGTRSPAYQAVAAYGVPAGDSCPHQREPTSLGPGCSARVAVAAYGRPTWDDSSHWRVPTRWQDGESSEGGSECLWSACR